MDGKTVCGCLAPPSTFLLSTFPHVHNFQMNHVLKTPAGRVLVNFLFSLSALLSLLYLGLGLASCIDWSRSYTNYIENFICFYFLLWNTLAFQT